MRFSPWSPDKPKQVSFPDPRQALATEVESPELAGGDPVMDGPPRDVELPANLVDAV
jgi:hypothetical protein